MVKLFILKHQALLNPQNSLFLLQVLNYHYKATISGKCCESGDVLIRDAFISKPERGDILAIFSTGAYCHSMSSNYNKLRKPPIVFFYNDNLKLVTKRESFEDLIRLDV